MYGRRDKERRAIEYAVTKYERARGDEPNARDASKHCDTVTGESARAYGTDLV